MREKLLIIFGFFISFGIGFMVGQIAFMKTQKPHEIVKQVVDRSLDKYTIENLKNARIENIKISIVKELKDYPNFISSEFMMEANSEKVSGMINIPKSEGKHPLIVMIRGYVPSQDYFIGNGTINSSIFFANNGFITISPDFLGYGDSDKEPDNAFEARFQTYTTVLALINSLKVIDKWDGENIFVWAHSNGGQIALTILEITEATYPTVLWAPVSVAFPYSILYFSNEADDGGKVLRRELARFEEIYDTDLYSLTKYLDRIKAPLMIDQGTNDEAVPSAWTDDLVKKLKDSPRAGEEKLDLTYNLYPGADHQMTPLWNSVISKDLEFFQERIKN